MINNPRLVSSGTVEEWIAPRGSDSKVVVASIIDTVNSIKEWKQSHVDRFNIAWRYKNDRQWLSTTGQELKQPAGRSFPVVNYAYYIASVYQAVLGSQPPKITFMPRHQLTIPASAAMNAAYYYVFDKNNGRTFHLEMLDDATTYGSAFAKVILDRHVWHPERVGIAWRRIDPYSIFPSKYAESLDDAEFIIEMKMISQSFARAYYGIEDVSADSAEQRRDDRRRPEDMDKTFSVPVYECWKKEYVKGEMYWRYIFIVGEKLLYDDVTPYQHQTHPYAWMKTSNETGIFVKSPIMQARPMQDVINRMIGHIMDYVVSSMPKYFVSSLLSLHVQHIRGGAPNDLIVVDTGPGARVQDMLHQIQANPPPAQIFNFIALAVETLKEITGATDVLGGGAVRGQREVGAVRQMGMMGSNRFQTLAIGMQDRLLKPMARKTISCWAQGLSDRFVSVLGPDPASMMGAVYVSKNTLNLDYDVILSTTDAVSSLREEQKNSIIEFFGRVANTLPPPIQAAFIMYLMEREFSDVPGASQRLMEITRQMTQMAPRPDGTSPNPQAVRGALGAQSGG